LLWEVSGTENTKSINNEVGNQSTYMLSAIPLNVDLSELVPTVSNRRIINNTINLGEAVYLKDNVIWGWISTLGYLYIVYEVFFGDVAKLSSSSNSPALGRAMFLLKIFITLGWSIYPIGYMLLDGNLLQTWDIQIDLIYNLADAINKIGFGLVVYSVAVAESNKK
jgi:bacteriorhodopsin